MKALLIVLFAFGFVGKAHAEPTEAPTSNTAPVAQQAAEKTPIIGTWKGEGDSGTLTFASKDSYTWKRAKCDKPDCAKAEMSGGYRYTGTMIMFFKGLGKRDLFYNVAFEKEGAVMVLTHGQSGTKHRFERQKATR